MVRIQIMSDLHLENDESYDRFIIRPEAKYLALLGDIGVVAYHHPRYLQFIERQLRLFDIVFYREQIDGEDPDWGEFVFLDNSRYDLADENVSILGATMFTDPPHDKIIPVNGFYQYEPPISGWSSQKHSEAHRETVEYLSREVNLIKQEDPERIVIILTHHSPTLSPRAMGPGFTIYDGGARCWHATNLRNQHPWAEAENVRLWAFGSTHYNCDYIKSDTGMRVYSNQRGYTDFEECRDFDVQATVDISNYDDPSEYISDRSWTP
ncbi:hypothetical protein F4811DRAFT_559928 [Daldinia bambusicola]|nr:hypothetical protein F4811DRAFT_559928 [Daldinia bambusicola]